MAGQKGKASNKEGAGGAWRAAEVCQQCCPTCCQVIIPSHCQEGAGIQCRYGWKTRGNPEIREHTRHTVGWVELLRENVAANRAALGAQALRQLCCLSRIREEATKEERIYCANKWTQSNQVGLTAKGREMQSKRFLVQRNTKYPKVTQAQSHGNALGTVGHSGKKLKAICDPKSLLVFFSLKNSWQHKL